MVSVQPFDLALGLSINASLTEVRRIVDFDDEDATPIQLDGLPLPVHVRPLKVDSRLAVEGVSQNVAAFVVRVPAWGVAVDDLLTISQPGSPLPTQTHQVTSVQPPRQGLVGSSAARLTTRLTT